MDNNDHTLIEFNKNDILHYYENYVINTNLKNLLKNGGSSYFGVFLNIDQIYVRGLRMDYTYHWDSIRNLHNPPILNNPFLSNWDTDKKKLLNNILINGLYFPLMITCKDGIYYIKEGHHRFSVLKVASAEGLIPKNFKVFCLVVPDNGCNVNIAKPVMCYKFIPNQNTNQNIVQIRKCFVDKLDEVFNIYWDSDRLVGRKLYDLEVPYLEYLQDQQSFDKWMQEG